MVTYQDIVSLVGFKVVNHRMTMMPLLFFFCNKQKDSKIIMAFLHHLDLMLLLEKDKKNKPECGCKSKTCYLYSGNLYGGENV